jgi:hypothetical protein
VAEQRFDVLKSLLSSAASMLQELVNNPLLERYLDVFARMPEGDREPLVGALEHEVQTRLLSQEVAQDFTQVELRPNPKAQFYLRVITPEQEAKVEMVPLLRAMYTMATGIDELDPHWLGLIGQALRQLDAGALEKLVSFNRAMQGLMDEALAASSGKLSADEDTTPKVAAQGKSGGPGRTR